MNWLLAVVIGIVIYFGIQGRRRGFIRTVFTLFSLIIALVLTYTLSPYISKALQKSEKIQGYVTKTVETVIKTEKEETVSDQVEYIDGLNLPKSLKTALIENNNKEVYTAFAVKSFQDYVNHYVVYLIMNALSFILTLMIIKILLFVAVKMLDILSKLPIINGLNKSAGLLVGILHGFIVVWVLCIFLTVFSGTEWGIRLYTMINESLVLTTIYDNNLLLSGITSIVKVLF